MMVVFEKGAAMRYIGHLDMMRTIQRALRRSGLPISFTKGFNPHVKLAFGVPLTVGVIGLRELMDVPVEEEISTDVFLDRMNAVLPDCFRMRECKPIPDDYPSLMSLVAGAEYRITFPDGEEARKAVAALNNFKTLDSFVTDRRTKSGEKPCDIIPFIQSVSHTFDGSEHVIELVTKALQSGMLKPGLWLDALCEFAGCESFPHLMYRTHILTLKGDKLIPMEER